MRITTIFIICLFCLVGARAQELNCRVRVNRSSVQGTTKTVFDNLETALNEFMNSRAWTDLQYSQEEKIECTMNLTVKQYKPDDNTFSCELLFQVIRPVWGSTYTTTIFSMRDTEFTFTYSENEALEFNEVSMDNDLTAMLAFYAYLFIGMDLDTFSPLGGTDVLRRAESIVNNAQSLPSAGWKAFASNKNRHAIINDYMETSMQPMRELMYKYHREGLDEMQNNADRGRAAITEAVELLGKAYKNKPLSQLPEIFTDYKRDELVSIYRGHGTANEKTKVYDILTEINAAQNAEWRRIQR